MNIDINKGPVGRNRRRSFVVHHKLSSSNIFDLESPNVTRISTPTYSKAASDIPSPTTPGRHFSKFKKRPKMPPLAAVGQILVARRFAWPNQLVGF